MSGEPSSVDSSDQAFAVRPAAIWHWLTEPSASIQEPERRRMARLLSSLLVSLIPLPILVLIVRTIVDPAFSPSVIALIGLAALGGAYALSRTDQYQWGAVLASLTFPLSILAIAITNYNPTDFKTLLAYLALGVLLGSMLLSTRSTAILVALNIVAVLLLPAFIPEVTLVDLISPLTFLILMATFTILADHHRDLLEKDRLGALAESEERFRSVAQTAADAIILADSAGIITYWNPAAQMIFGHPAEEAIGEPLTLIMPGRFRADHKAGVKRLTSTGESTLIGRTIELTGLRRDGNEFPLEISLSTWQASDQTLFSAVIRDTTSRKMAEMALRNLNTELEQRVVTRTAELEAAYERLQALSRLKDEFVANVSHELRTPVTSLKLYHQLLESNPQKAAIYLETLQRETDRLAHIIESLLILSRMDQGEVQFNIDTVDLNALVQHCVDDRHLLAESKGLTLTRQQEPGLPQVQADEDLLGQVLSILLTNAFNYTPSGGSVVVRTHMKEVQGKQWAGFSVSDTGPGIPPDEQTQLFERFFRGQVGHKSGTGGTGLGLAIAREIVDRHQGHMGVKSEGVPGEGATFTVWLLAEQVNVQNGKVSLARRA